MTSLFAGLIVVVIIGGWLGMVLLGSVVALRGVRNWTTILQVCGAALNLIGAGTYGLGLFLTIRAWAPGSGGSSMDLWRLLLGLSGIVVILGIVLFTAGYKGTCAKYGATGRRAQELEVLTEQLQSRLQSGA